MERNPRARLVFAAVAGAAGIAAAILLLARSSVLDPDGVVAPEPRLAQGAEPESAPRGEIAGEARRRALEALDRLPLAFEPADDAGGAFVARAPGYAVRVDGAGATVRALGADGAAATVGLRIAGAGDGARVEARSLLPGRMSSFRGADPSAWRASLPRYAEVAVRRVLEGIDLVFYGSGRRLEYDVVLAPGVDPRSVEFEVDGAGALSVDAQGNLVIHAGPATLVQRAPRAFQPLEGEERPVEARYALREAGGGGVRVGFDLLAWDPRAPLVIDPVLTYATYVGGDTPALSRPAADDVALAVAVDAAGMVYVTGRTVSTDFPATAGALDRTFGGGDKDAFVLKLDPARSGASSLVYATYLGGASADEGWGVAVDAAGAAYVVGFSFSNDFPTVSAGQPSLAGGGDAFVAKLSPSGASLVYSTYLGGGGDDFAFAVAVSATGEAYVQGRTESSNFLNGSVTDDGGPAGHDAFVARVSAAGAILNRMYVGGSGDDEALMGIEVDAGGRAHICGVTASDDFPATASAYQPALEGGRDGFYAVVKADFSGLDYATYYGTPEDDTCQSLRLLSSGLAAVVGLTTSNSLTTTAGAVTPLAPTLGADVDGYLAVFDPAASGAASYVYGTYIGGSGNERAFAVARTAADEIVVAGETDSLDLDAHLGAGSALQSGPSGGLDIFVVQIATPTPLPLFFTYLGGGVHDGGSATTAQNMGVAVDAAGAVIVAASTYSVAPAAISTTAAAFDRTGPATPGAGSDLYIAKICITDTAPPSILCPGPSSAAAGPGGTAPAPDRRGAATVSDGCTPHERIVVSQSPAPGTALAFGTHLLFLTAQDLDGRTASCTATFTVLDTTPPSLTVPGPRTAAADALAGTAPVPDLAALSLASDNTTPPASIALTQAPLAGSAAGRGAHTVVVTATDQAGNSTAAGVTFTVLDVTPPVFTSGPVGATAAAAGAVSGTAPVPNVTPTASVTDNTYAASELVLVQSPAPGAAAGPGITVITVTATDPSGNASSRTTMFTVLDVTPPVFVSGPTGATAAAGAISGTAPVPDVRGSAVVADNTTAPGAIALVQAPAPGTAAARGDTSVVVTATDASGNSASRTVTFTVLDVTPPVFSSAPAPRTAAADAAGVAPVPAFAASATDNTYPQAALVFSQAPAAGTLRGRGVHAVAVSVVDPSGNLASLATTFTVLDVTPPVIASAPTVAAVGADGRAPEVAALVVASDNCTPAGLLVIVQAPPTGVTLTGETSVTVTVTDEDGNASSVVVALRPSPPRVAGGGGGRVRLTGGGCSLREGAEGDPPWVLLALAPLTAAWVAGRRRILDPARAG